MYVCLCKGLTESDVNEVARAGSTTVKALIRGLGLDAEDCCGRCALAADELLALVIWEDTMLKVSRHRPAWRERAW
jgi:bacterioferritin-associated ferredoxin